MTPKQARKIFAEECRLAGADTYGEQVANGYDNSHAGDAAIHAIMRAYKEGQRGTVYPLCLAAYTPPGSNYPPYVNATLFEQDAVRVTVRAPYNDETHRCGDTCAMVMTRAEFTAFCDDALNVLGELK